MALPLPRARVTLPSRDCAAADADSWSQPYHQTRAPFQPAPGCCMTVANHWRQQRVAWSSIRLRAARASAPPGCTGGIPRIPSPLSAHDGRSCTPRLAILKKWWLQRVEGEEAKICVVGEILTPQMILQMSEGESSSKGGMACKVFRSRAIVKCLAYNTIESEDGYTILIHGGFNISKTRENGFSEKVCKSFVCDFRVGWQSLINLKMVPDDEHARSSLETPSPSVGDNFNICGRPQDLSTGLLVDTGPRRHDSQRLWELDWLRLPSAASASLVGSASPASASSFAQWHHRLGHLCGSWLSTLVRRGVLGNVFGDDKCQGCKLGKRLW